MIPSDKRPNCSAALFESDTSAINVTGPGGQQILLFDPAGNLVELFQPAAR